MLKGIVQQDVRGVESRVKLSVLINCLVALVLFFLNQRDTPAREVKNQFQRLNNY